MNLWMTFCLSFEAKFLTSLKSIPSEDSDFESLRLKLGPPQLLGRARERQHRGERKAKVVEALHVNGVLGGGESGRARTKSSASSETFQEEVGDTMTPEP